MLAFVKALCHNSIVATATESEASLGLERYRAGSGSNKRVKGDKLIMAYKDSLKPWAVVRLGKKLQWVTIARYKSRSDADGHLLLLRQRVPDIE